MDEVEIEALPLWARWPVRQMVKRIEQLEAAIRACPRVCGYGANQLNQKKEEAKP